MLVKIKPEIIPLGISSIDPEAKPAPTISPQRLKAWLDEGRELVLLDTRNDYEVEYGTFEKAVKLDLQHFRNFPDVVRQLPSGFKDKPIVSFCTGGIRCEKAAPYLLEQGYKEVYQLAGGILQYFEECGDAHYKGDCYVFDKRVAVTPQLAPVNNIAQCSICSYPVDLSTSEIATKALCANCFEG
jgi:UPF0176 protein